MSAKTITVLKATMKFVIFLLSFLSLLCSCNNKKADANSQVKFDKVKWQTKDGDAYPYRDAMLDNLIDSVNLKRIPYDSLINILGQPDRVNEGHLYYNISGKKVGVFTFGTKSFVIKLKPDSTVEWRKIYGG